MSLQPLLRNSCGAGSGVTEPVPDGGGDGGEPADGDPAPATAGDPACLSMVDYKGDGKRGSSAPLRASFQLGASEPFNDSQPTLDPTLDPSGAMSVPDKTLQCSYLGRKRAAMKATIQGKVYNFLERPTGWKCFIYHFTV